MPKKKSTKKTVRKSKFTAKTADKHDLYQRSVQDAETEIYFTRDGSDPRRPGGNVSSQAAKYSEPFSLKGSEVLFARSKSGARWSGPRILKPAVLTRR